MELQSEMYLTHWTHKSGQLSKQLCFAVVFRTGVLVIVLVTVFEIDTANIV